MSRDTQYFLELMTREKIAEAMREVAHDRLALTADNANRGVRHGLRMRFVRLFRRLANGFAFVRAPSVEQARPARPSSPHS
jgi:hypothetical protein